MNWLLRAIGRCHHDIHAPAIACSFKLGGQGRFDAQAIHDRPRHVDKHVDITAAASIIDARAKQPNRRVVAQTVDDCSLDQLALFRGESHDT